MNINLKEIDTIHSPSTRGVNNVPTSGCMGKNYSDISSSLGL